MMIHTLCAKWAPNLHTYAQWPGNDNSNNSMQRGQFVLGDCRSLCSELFSFPFIYPLIAVNLLTPLSQVYMMLQCAIVPQWNKESLIIWQP